MSVSEASLDKTPNLTNTAKIFLEIGEDYRKSKLNHLAFASYCKAYNLTNNPRIKEEICEYMQKVLPGNQLPSPLEVRERDQQEKDAGPAWINIGSLNFEYAAAISQVIYQLESPKRKIWVNFSDDSIPEIHYSNRSGHSTTDIQKNLYGLEIKITGSLDGQDVSTIKATLDSHPLVIKAFNPVNRYTCTIAKINKGYLEDTAYQFLLEKYDPDLKKLTIDLPDEDDPFVYTDSRNMFTSPQTPSYIFDESQGYTDAVLAVRSCWPVFCGYDIIYTFPTLDMLNFKD